jgi:hypothetical protein
MKSWNLEIFPEFLEEFEDFNEILKLKRGLHEILIS